MEVVLECGMTVGNTSSAYTVQEIDTISVDIALVKAILVHKYPPCK